MSYYTLVLETIDTQKRYRRVVELDYVPVAGHRLCFRDSKEADQFEVQLVVHDLASGRLYVDVRWHSMAWPRTKLLDPLGWTIVPEDR